MGSSASRGCSSVGRASPTEEHLSAIRDHAALMAELAPTDGEAAVRALWGALQAIALAVEELDRRLRQIEDERP